MTDLDSSISSAMVVETWRVLRRVQKPQDTGPVPNFGGLRLLPALCVLSIDIHDICNRCNHSEWTPVMWMEWLKPKFESIIQSSKYWVLTNVYHFVNLLIWVCKMEYFVERIGEFWAKRRVSLVVKVEQSSKRSNKKKRSHVTLILVQTKDL